ncbi:MAG: hypothetical protein AVDCRST_MAG77-3126 [uncultured Chloroflexi bacterium]|uniref:CsbD-like domain-containing protein n=1 Tax=uncultured Chloroflexota bacterium TaxID=166587 RepID=A0A6J4J899_9CHLR|nr:MAG: hypothetical protein AVDCRST_MAG77-3126 [uncultured Chloroflexota bacterium]
MARDISDVEKQNPNARQQNDEWRKLRAERGEDPNDAAAFRQHQQAIGAPDPGAGAVKDTAGAAKRETEGVKDQLAGTLKAGAGKILGNDQLASDGEAQQQRGSFSRKAD